MPTKRFFKEDRGIEAVNGRGRLQKKYYWRARRSEWSLCSLTLHETKSIQTFEAASSRCHGQKHRSRHVLGFSMYLFLAQM